MPAKNNQSRLLTWKGRTQTIEAWAAETKIPDATIRSRIDRLKWAVAKALSTPIDRRFAKSTGRPAAGAVRSPPQLKKHASGQAFARWSENGKKHHRYFGPWKSEKARAGYAAFLRDWSAGVGASRPTAAAGALPTVGALVGAWLTHAKSKYTKLGKQTSAYHVCRAVATALMKRHELTATAEFGLVELEAVRADMVGNGWVRKTVNDYITRAVGMFGWGVPRKLVPVDVHYALQQIDLLAPGATAAPEPTPVRSAPSDHVEALLAGPYLHADPDRRSVLGAMIRVQLLTGMRPNELCAFRAAHVDRSGEEWRYTVPPSANKNFHREQKRVVWIGPRAQAVLAPLLAAAGEGPVFTFPAKGKRRACPVSRDQYGRLVRAACERAGVEPWHPHQLRHNKATDVRRLYESSDAARDRHDGRRGRSHLHRPARGGRPAHRSRDGLKTVYRSCLTWERPVCLPGATSAGRFRL